jgi:hypothetical protein
MSRRGFLRAVGATGLGLWWPGLAVWFGESKKTAGELIRQALQERREVQFRYHGYSRRMLGWQVSGGSASEPPPGWRTFALAEMKAMKLRRGTFAPRPDYRPETTRLKLIEAEVTPAP